MNDLPSAVIVRIRVPTAIDRLRRAHDPSARDGIPAHVTILYPFVSSGLLDGSMRRDLADVAGRAEPFDVAFRRVRTWPGVVYLEPEPAAPFIGLIAAVAARFPAYPPYEGVHDTVVPHLTVMERDDVPAGPVVAAAAGVLPFAARAAALEVLVLDPDLGRWRRRWRIALGARIRR